MRGSEGIMNRIGHSFKFSAGSQRSVCRTSYRLTLPCVGSWRAHQLELLVIHSYRPLKRPRSPFWLLMCLPLRNVSPSQLHFLKHLYYFDRSEAQFVE